MKTLIKILLIFFSTGAFAQDVLVKNDKTELKVKVLELTDEVIKYKKFEMQDGPTYNISKSDVFMIIYKNGTKEYIESRSNQARLAETSASRQNKNTVNDEDLSFNSKSKGLFFGLGIGSGLSSAGAEMTIPPIQLRYEWAVSPNISIGLTGATLAFDIPGIGYNAYSGATYSTTTEFHYLTLSGRGNYHFATTGKFDPYVGASIGYNYELGQEAGSAFAGGQIGANYYFSKKIGAWAEAGYGIGYLNLGVTIKL